MWRAAPVTMLTVAAVLCGVAFGRRAADASFWVSPAGSDASSGSQQDPFATLGRALSACEEAKIAPGGSADVLVLPGRYELTEPLVFKGVAADKVVALNWIAPHGNVTISGGSLLTGWRPGPPPAQAADAAVTGAIDARCPGQGDQQVDCGFKFSTEAECAAKGCCWTPGGLSPSGHYCNHRVGSQANLSVFTTSAARLHSPQGRHLFVNGKRASRPMLIDVGAAFKGSILNADGFWFPGQGTLGWASPGAEFLWPQSTSPWTEPRCTVANVTAGARGGVQVNLMQPCWANLRQKPCGQNARGPPAIVENVVGPLSSFGRNDNEWYLGNGSAVYYVTAADAGKNITAYMPQLETLMQAQGAPDAAVSNITFSDLLFEHTTWLRPSQGDGYVEQQSGCCLTGTDFTANADCNNDFLWHKSPGGMVFHNARNVLFQGCEFRHFGGVGLDFGNGSQGNAIQHCYFHDISGAAVQFGSFDTFNQSDPALQDRDFILNNSVIHNAAAEFHGAVGVNVGYTANTLITHNDIGFSTYSGLSMGWGWSRHPEAFCHDNIIAFNKIHDYKQALNDGGGIYMLGPQHNSVIHDNWVYNQGTASSGALYPDEGSCYSTWRANVVSNIGASEWLHLWTGSIHNVTVEDNYADTSKFRNQGTNCPMINNTVFAKGSPPASAQAIMASAGPQGARWPL